MLNHRTNQRSVTMVTTRTGLTIGSAYLPPAPQPTRDGELLQRALLDKPRLIDRAAAMLEALGMPAYITIVAIGLGAAVLMKLAR